MSATKPADPLHTAEDFVACFEYNPITGALAVRSEIADTPGPKRSHRAYRLNSRQHIMDGRSYSNSHIAWALLHGLPTPSSIYFKNGDRSDLRAENLVGVTSERTPARSDPNHPQYRPISIHKNPFVRWDVIARKWRPILNHPTRGYVPVGEFDDETEAVFALVRAKDEMHRERAAAARPTTLAQARAERATPAAPQPTPTNITPIVPLSYERKTKLSLGQVLAGAASGGAASGGANTDEPDYEAMLAKVLTPPPAEQEEPEIEFDINSLPAEDRYEEGADAKPYTPLDEAGHASIKDIIENWDE